MSTYGYLAHHGIKGQKWGVRRYQNPDGTLTPAGRERYYKDRIKELKNEYNSKTPKEKRSESGLNRYIQDNYGENYKEDKKISEDRTAKKVRIGAGIVLGTAAVAAGSVMALDALGEISMINAGLRESRSDWQQRVDNMLKDENMDKIEKDSKIHRITFGNANASTNNKKVYNDSLYVTDNEGDRELYKQVLNPAHQGGGTKKEITYKVKNDIYTAQGKVLLDYALEAIGANESIDDIDTDACKAYDNSYGRGTKPKGYDSYKAAQNAIFSLVLKDSSGKLKSEGSSKLRDKLIEEGYGAVKDYQDAGLLGKSPKILLDAANDVNVDGIREVDRISEILSRIKLGALRFGT